MNLLGRILTGLATDPAYSTRQQPYNRAAGSGLDMPRRPSLLTGGQPGGPPPPQGTKPDWIPNNGNFANTIGHAILPDTMKNGPLTSLFGSTVGGSGKGGGVGGVE